ncbi:MAG: vitamin B12 transporter [Lentimonas sp.]|jgi:vitamin B12 transporter
MLNQVSTSFPFLSLPLLSAALASVAVAQSEPVQVGALPTLAINTQKTANLRPAATYETPISNLEFEPRIDLQSRNMAEAQGDVSIRGGIFENTGFRVGSVTLFDPQTGHYSAELPIAPEMLVGPKVQTGAENALLGFNSAVGTISYSWSPIVDGGSLTAGGGNNALNFQRLHHAWTRPLNQSGEWSIGVEAEVSRSESDGTVKYSDHDFNRSSGRLQLRGPNSQTDLFAGYQSKSFGQYGMYTGDQYIAFNPYETENIKTRLFILNHLQSYGERSQWEATAYYRRNSDHYIFNRLIPNKAFIHETDATALGFSGLHALDDSFAIHYAGQVTSDDIESTNLEQGDFTSRTYYKFSLLPEYRIELDAQQSIVVKAGASFDDSNRDASEFSPIAEIAWLKTAAAGESQRAYLSYAQTTQLPGYTAIGGSEVSGLFRSKHDLGRETTENLELGFALQRTDWSVEAAVFYRWDDDLVDWTFTGAGARAANNVDIETFGFEWITTRRWEQLEAIASYTYLHKQEDYGNPAVIGSFYALNFPEHRATLGLIWSPIQLVEIRLDNEWRQQQANPLRSGPDSALFSHLAASYYPSQIEGLELFVAWDKPWNEDFQDVPGTPGRGDQYSSGLSYRW